MQCDDLRKLTRDTLGADQNLQLEATAWQWQHYREVIPKIMCFYNYLEHRADRTDEKFIVYLQHHYQQFDHFEPPSNHIMAISWHYYFFSKWISSLDPEVRSAALVIFYNILMQKQVSADAKLRLILKQTMLIALSKNSVQVPQHDIYQLKSSLMGLYKRLISSSESHTIEKLIPALFEYEHDLSPLLLYAIVLSGKQLAFDCAFKLLEYEALIASCSSLISVHGFSINNAFSLFKPRFSTQHILIYTLGSRTEELNHLFMNLLNDYLRHNNPGVSLEIFNILTYSIGKNGANYLYSLAKSNKPDILIRVFEIFTILLERGHITAKALIKALLRKNQIELKNFCFALTQHCRKGVIVLFDFLSDCLSKDLIEPIELLTLFEYADNNDYFIHRVGEIYSGSDPEMQTIKTECNARMLQIFTQCLLKNASTLVSISDLLKEKGRTKKNYFTLIAEAKKSDLTYLVLAFLITLYRDFGMSPDSVATVIFEKLDTSKTTVFYELVLTHRDDQLVGYLSNFLSEIQMKDPGCVYRLFRRYKMALDNTNRLFSLLLVLDDASHIIQLALLSNMISQVNYQIDEMKTLAKIINQFYFGCLDNNPEAPKRYSRLFAKYCLSVTLARLAIAQCQIDALDTPMLFRLITPLLDDIQQHAQIGHLQLPIDPSRPAPERFSQNCDAVLDNFIFYAIQISTSEQGSFAARLACIFLKYLQPEAIVNQNNNAIEIDYRLLATDELMQKHIGFIHSR